MEELEWEEEGFFPIFGLHILRHGTVQVTLCSMPNGSVNRVVQARRARHDQGDTVIRPSSGPKFLGIHLASLRRQVVITQGVQRCCLCP